jgi:Fur family ferric uptake transcriptional regulator
MTEPLQQLQQSLKGQGSLTRPRQVVFSALLGREPQTMAQLVAACASQIDRASVYRTIALFEKLGVVQRLQIGWKYKLELSDTFHHHHHHLTCLKCGRTTPLPEDKQLESRLQQLAKAQNFTMQGHQLEIQGLCRDCVRSR